MKNYHRLLLLAVLGIPLLYGCGGGSDDNTKPATFGDATFNNTTWN